MKLYFSADQARIKTKKASPKDLLLCRVFEHITKACSEGKYTVTMPDSEVNKIAKRKDIDEVVETLDNLNYKACFDFPGIVISWKEEQNGK